MAQGMECGCACDLDGYDHPEVFDCTEPVARKQHTCCECGAAILPGEQYHRAFGVWGGDAETFKTCRICATIRVQYCCCFGELRQTLWELLGMDYVTGEQ